MEKSLPLNIYLLKKGRLPDNQIDLSDFKATISIPVDKNYYSTLYFKVSGSEPEWITSLKSIANSDIDFAKSASPQAILFIRHKQRWFVATFGHAWQKAASADIEPDFGTRCVLNIAKTESLSSIRRDRVADSAIQAIEQIPESDDISRFGMDVERDILRGVKAKVDKSYRFGHSVVGGDSFKGTIDLSSDSIGAFCRRALKCYGRKDISVNFPWFDKIKPINDDAIIDKLETRLARAISLRVKFITLSVPELLAWDEFDAYSFTKLRKGHLPVSEPLTIEQWRNAHVTGRVIPSTLRSSSVYAYKAGQTHLSRKWDIRQCINATIKFKTETYITQLGKWYKVDNNFVKEIHERVALIPSEKRRFPKLKYTGESEGDYNKRIGNSFRSRYYYLDKDLIPVVGRSSIEVCDLLRFDGSMVCVKPWGGRSQDLSHLFQQAIVAGQLLADHPPFIAGVSNKILNPRFKAIWDKEATKKSGARFVLAIIRGVPKERLPFFAQVALVTCFRNLREMRFDVSYAVIG
ncbi:hypothetical protein NB722_003736 [Xanthomonas sacchari]|uniref:DUF6119 family protein n=1 Tax=Xanthomonas sacchari TaxID=56458 RepID=UPI00225B8097|nr:DUF6119 family protein [Xanthomonas sacchari]MCW0389197.1 hypothetical protein [Xanthomonas sacchari]